MRQIKRIRLPLWNYIAFSFFQKQTPDIELKKENNFYKINI